MTQHIRQGLTDVHAMLLYRADESSLGDVVHGFFPGMPEKAVPSSVLHEIDAALVIPAWYNGPGVSNAAPGTTSQGAGAPGGPTC